APGPAVRDRVGPQPARRQPRAHPPLRSRGAFRPVRPGRGGASQRRLRAEPHRGPGDPGPVVMKLHKYPRTHHLEGSRLQPGDEDLDSVPFDAIRGRHIVAEEKLDGANAGLRLGASGQLFLQSRGHFLTGGVREKHFNFFKQWAASVAHLLWPALGERYALFGEWLYAKHTVYYDQLPHYFLEFDILDLQYNCFLSTPLRQELLAGLPVVSVPVL